MVARARWWFSAIIAVFTILSTFAPLGVSAQDSATSAPSRQSATVIVDSTLYIEPTAESAPVDTLVAGSEVTLLDSPLTSVFDGQIWIQAASANGAGFMLLSNLSTSTPDPVTEPAPLIVAWKLVRTQSEVPCLAEAAEGSEWIATLYPGQEVGLTANPVEGWQAVVCDDKSGFVSADVFEIEAPGEDQEGGESPVVETSTPETPLPDQTESTATPDETTPDDATASPEIPETPIPAATTEPGDADISTAPSVEAEVAAAAALGPEPIEEGNGQVSAIIGGGTGYVVGTDGDGVRCRAGANTSAATITVLPEGAAVTSRGAASGSWQPVYCAGQNGFVWAEYVGNTPGSSSSTGSTGTVRGTNGDWLRCRTGASTTAAVITALAPGASATIRGSSQNGWIPVVCGGQNGFVHSDYFGAGAGTTNPSTGRFATGQSVHVANTDGTGVRFRSSASYSGAVISVLVDGSGLTVRAGTVGEWIAVSRGGSNGFIHQDFLAAGTGAASGSGSTGSSDLTAGSKGRVTESLRLRSGASLSSQTLAIAGAGIVVKITGSASNGFYPVSWDGLNGYMYKDFLVYSTAALSSRSTTAPGSTTPVGNAGSASGSATGQSVVNYALRYVGYPYVWGGRGPNGFDCAGFVYWTNFNITGVNLVGGVINQYTYGRPIPWGQLQPGDIVFFTNTYQPGLSHNGIYIGNNQFVHASNPTDGVIISNLTNSYYLPRWYGARRII